MSIPDLELAELKTRTANAIRTKSSLANVNGHIETLEATIGKSRLSKAQAASTPTAYLYQLILLAESLGSEPVQVEEPVQVREPEPEPVPTIKVVETPVVAPSDEAVEESAVPEESKAKEHSERHSKSKRDKRDKKP